MHFQKLSVYDCSYRNMKSVRMRVMMPCKWSRKNLYFLTALMVMFVFMTRAATIQQRISYQNPSFSAHLNTHHELRPQVANADKMQTNSFIKSSRFKKEWPRDTLKQSSVSSFFTFTLWTFKYFAQNPIEQLPIVLQLSGLKKPPKV